MPAKKPIKKHAYEMSIAELGVELAKAKRAHNCLPQDITYWQGWIDLRKEQPLPIDMAEAST